MSLSELPLRKIVSGGQTGADRVALDWARDHDFPHGGWCPAERRAEDGEISGEYRLRETPHRGYQVRTLWNVRDSDATVIFSLGRELTGGSKRTLEFARQLGKPCLHLSKAKTKNPPARLRTFIDEHFVEVLNIAGPRASGEPGIGAFVREVLDEALKSS